MLWKVARGGPIVGFIAFLKTIFFCKLSWGILFFTLSTPVCIYCMLSLWEKDEIFKICSSPYLSVEKFSSSLNEKAAFLWMAVNSTQSFVLSFIDEKDNFAPSIDAHRWARQWGKGVRYKTRLSMKKCQKPLKIINVLIP